jgi:TP901 family phage tail tape measure protein
MGVRSITVYVLGDGTGLTRTLNRASVDLDRFVADTEKKGGRLGTVLGSGLTKGLAGAGVAVAAGLGLAAAAAVPFEAAMHNVATISSSVQANMGGAEKAVLDLSTTVPQAATVLAKGLYEIVSSNFQGAEAFHVLEVSAKAASAGLTDTDTSARAITGALNAYGLSAASAGDVSDILFQTVNKGVVSFGDLAQNLGDFVGTAAAAKVPLQDVASAYAAITLSGVPAAEAATSVNQLLTHLLRPSKELAGLYKQLGYESGAAALQQKGLAGVVRDIGKATDGSAASIVKLFGRVESSKALLALLAADGKNYQAAIDGITDASQRTGATQRAFTEQMKSTEAQLRLTLNAAEAFGIGVGLKVLPSINAFLAAARSAGSDALPYVEAALHRVAPLFEQLWAIAGNVASILIELGRDAAPFVQALAQIGAATVVGPLMLFLGVLQHLTQFLADHRVIVEAVAAVYLARLIPSLIAAGVQMGVAAARTVVTTAATWGLEASVLGANSALIAMGSAAKVASIGLTAGLAVAILAVSNTLQNISDAQSSSADVMKKFREEFDATDFNHTAQQLQQLNVIYQKGQAYAEEYGSAWGQVKAVFNDVAGDGSVQKVLQEGADAKKVIDDFAQSTENAHENLNAVAKATGLTTDALGELAKRANIDLSGTFDSSADARKRLIGYVKDLKHADDVTAASISANAGIDAAAMQELQKAIDGVVKAATKAFEKDTDVLGNFGTDTVKEAKKVADAQEALAKARKTSGSTGASSLANEQRIARDRRAIQDAEEKAAVSHTKSLSSQVSQRQTIQRAQRKLADDEALIAAKGSGGGASASVVNAQAALAKAQAAAASDTLQAQYAKAIQLGKNFTKDINVAVQRGLDPNVIGKLLTEGPAKAEPALQAILADHSGRIIRMVNQSEAAIANLSGYVAEQARIAALAMNAPTDQYTKDLKSAMALAAAEAASGGRSTMEALVRSLRIPASEIRRIAAEFGITLAANVQAAVNRAGPIQVNARGSLFVTDDRQGGALPPRGRSIARAEGGGIDSGPFGRDQVPVMATRGEWVQPKAAVDHYGAGFMEAIRTRTLPKLWDGGMVGANGALISSVLNVAGPRIVPVPVPVANRSSTDNSQTYNIDRVVVGSLDQLPAASGGRTYSATKGVT